MSHWKAEIVDIVYSRNNLKLLFSLIHALETQTLISPTAKYRFSLRHMATTCNLQQDPVISHQFPSSRSPELGASRIVWKDIT